MASDGSRDIYVQMDESSIHSNEELQKKMSLETPTSTQSEFDDMDTVIDVASLKSQGWKGDEESNADGEATDIADIDSDDSMDAKRSLSNFAQLMLPALIENKVRTDENSNNRRLAPGGNRLLRRANTQIRRGAAGVRDMAGRAHSAGKRKVEELQEKPPLCYVIASRAYHKYGLKHLVLILVFVAYTAFGGLVYLLLEREHHDDLKSKWDGVITANRTKRVDELMGKVFNNSNYLIYIKGTTTDRLELLFKQELKDYEDQLGIKWHEQKMALNYWSALLFAGTICTTIGYGHIYPLTMQGKIFTMIYASFGIPLMLLVLQDFGKMLTITMKFPWFQTKRLFRRMLRCCTKQSLREMREIEACERRDLDVFDLPLIVGIGVVVLWVLLCSFVLYRWDTKRDWSLLEAFYFFFISLSTVGLGDIVPSSPELLLTMFGFILVGLSLVSMVINLLQTKMRTTYEAGQTVEVQHKKISQTRTTMGILQVYEDNEEKKSISERSLSRSTQTSLSLPGVRQVVLRSDGVHWVSAESPMKSPDEVTRLVELESSLRVCEQIGDHNEEDEDHGDSLVGETDVLLEQEEDWSR